MSKTLKALKKMRARVKKGDKLRKKASKHKALTTQQKKDLAKAVSGYILGGAAVGAGVGAATSHKGKRKRAAKHGAIAGSILGGAPGGVIGGTGAGLYQRGVRKGRRTRKR